MAKTLTSWSVSRYHTYKQCPLKAKLAFIDKIKEPPNDAMARGAAIHKLCEDFLKGTIKTLPPELSKPKAEFQVERKRVAKRSLLTVVEDSWALTKAWTKTRWDDWALCWLRLKLDYAYEHDGTTLRIRDWKTGKFRPDNLDEYLEQLELYALVGMIMHPHIQRVEPMLVYLDFGIVYPGADDQEIVFTRDDIPRLTKAWEARVKPMLNDTQFAPKPNRFCSWCHYRKSNKANGGGQCQY